MFGLWVLRRLSRMTEQEILKKAVEKFGTEAQLRQLQEECAELIVAVNHYLRMKTNGMNNLMEEVVDVKIMIKQIECSFGSLGERIRDVYEEEKLKRLEEMVK